MYLLFHPVCKYLESAIFVRVQIKILIFKAFSVWIKVLIQLYTDCLLFPEIFLPQKIKEYGYICFLSFIFTILSFLRILSCFFFLCCSFSLFLLHKKIILRFNFWMERKSSRKNRKLYYSKIYFSEHNIQISQEMFWSHLKRENYHFLHSLSITLQFYSHFWVFTMWPFSWQSNMLDNMWFLWQYELWFL